MDLDLDQPEATVVPVHSLAIPVSLSWRNIPEYMLMFRPHLIALVALVNVISGAFIFGGGVSVWRSGAEFESRQAAIKPQQLGVIEARKQAISQSDWIKLFDSERGKRQHLQILETFRVTKDISRFDLVVVTDYFLAFGLCLRGIVSGSRTKMAALSFNVSRRYLKTSVGPIDRAINYLFRIFGLSRWIVPRRRSSASDARAFRRN